MAKPKGVGSLWKGREKGGKTERETSRQMKGDREI